MSNLILTNNSSQVESTISQYYCRLTGSFIGPLAPNIAANSGFLIQNGNKQSGLFVGNTCVTFYNNCLNFDPANTDVNLNIPDSKAFIITGNGSLMTFGANGTLAVGTSIDTNYKGIQVVNSNPIFLLKDSDSVNQSGTQALSFFDSNSILSTSLCNEPASVINATTNNATNIVYNKYFRLKNNPTNGGGSTLIASNNNLTLFSGNCLNTSFNLAVGGTSFFSSTICSCGAINSAGLSVFSQNSFLDGSGDNVGQSIIQRKAEANQFIDFSNKIGQQHSSIQSAQLLNGASYIQFYTTPVGDYSLDRRVPAMHISSDKKVYMYGDVCASTACFSYISINGISNNSARTYFGFDPSFNQWFGAMKSDGTVLTEPYSLGYGFSATNGYVASHSWIVSGSTAMNLNLNKNLTVTGCLFSSGINSNAALVVNNLYNTDSCIRSRCIVFCANGANQNIINCGTFVNYGGNACFSGICSTGNQLNCMNGCLCLQTNLYTNCVCLTAGGGVCGPFGCFTNCSQSQVVCSNSCVRGNSICSNGTTFLNCFENSIHVNGSISGINTNKAWGIYGISAANTTFTGWNIKSINIYQNATSIYAYGICFNNPIKYPFIANFNVYSSGNALITGHINNSQFGEQLGFSGAGGAALLGNSASIANNPYSVQFYSLSGKQSSNCALSRYVAGTTYSEIYFNFANSKNTITPLSELTRTSVGNAIVHFSILGE